jgi:hypothetical protein
VEKLIEDDDTIVVYFAQNTVWKVPGSVAS